MCEIPENTKCENLKSGFYCAHWSDQILSDLVGSFQMLLIKQKYILQPTITRVTGCQGLQLFYFGSSKPHHC